MADWAQVAIAFFTAATTIASAYFANRSRRESLRSKMSATKAHHAAERAEASMRPPPEDTSFYGDGPRSR